MRPIMALGTCILLSGLVLGAVLHTSGAAAATHGVRVGDDLKFHDGVNANSSTTTIAAGDTVLWTWDGGMPHSVTSDSGVFDDPTNSFKNSGTFSFTFMTPGTYAYFCRVHGGAGGIGMAGTIVVEAAAPTATTAANTPTTSAQSTGTATPISTGTATAQVTGTSTGTVAAGTSTPVASSTPAAAAPAPSVLAPARTGGTGAGSALPNAGTGAASGSGTRWLPVALVVVGASMLGAGVGARMLRRRRA